MILATLKRNKIIEQQNSDNNHLSIQLRSNGFSFCIINKDSNQALYFDNLTIKGSSITPQKQIDHITKAFETHEQLQQQFKSIYVVHSNKLATIVPLPFFNKENLGDYLQYNVKLLNNDFIAYDELDSTELVNVYIPYVYLNNFLFDKFGSFDYKHSSSVLIELLLKKNKNSTATKFYVNVEEDIFQIMVLKDKKLQFFNSYSFKSKEDFIYYILFAAEQVHLNPEEFQLIFLGDIEEDSELYKITYNYVRNVSFYSENNETSEHFNHSNVVLLSLV